jgi:hypothetical protein
MSYVKPKFFEDKCLKKFIRHKYLEGCAETMIRAAIIRLVMNLGKRYYYNGCRDWQNASLTRTFMHLTILGNTSIP